MTLFWIVVALLALLGAGLPVAFSLAGLGAVMLWLKGLPLVMVAQSLHGSLDDFVLLSVPLFLLMSNILLKGGVGRDLFEAIEGWVGHWPGGLGIAALISCGIFAAISGSSVATAATVGTVAIPEMTTRGYGRAFTLGLLAAGGTLGILIPPSIPLIVYGVVTEESIGKLFLAGIGPGLLLLAFFAVYCVGYALVSKEYRPTPKTPLHQRWPATRRAAPTVALAALIIGGIYSGAFTPTEASAIGCALAFLLCTVVLRSITWPDLVQAVRDSVSTTIVLLLIVIGAKIFGKAVTIYQVPAQVSTLFDTGDASAPTFLLIVGGILLFIGLFLESLSMLLIMMPVLFPTVVALGIDPVWFAIFFVVLIEVALLTPPVGLNLFVIQAVAGSTLSTVVRGVIPFVLIMLASVVLFWAVPWLVLAIPGAF